VQVPSPSSPLWANAWQVPPATCARCHIYFKDCPSCTAFQFGLNTRELCFFRWTCTRPLAIPTFDFSFMFLVLGIFTTEGEKKIIILILARVGCTAKQISVIYFVIFEW